MSSRQAVNLDYLHYLRQALLNPLQRHGAEGATQAVKLLDDYQLIKEDVDSIMEISVWGGQPDPYSKLDSKVSRRRLGVYFGFLRWSFNVMYLVGTGYFDWLKKLAATLSAPTCRIWVIPSMATRSVSKIHCALRRLFLLVWCSLTHMSDHQHAADPAALQNTDLGLFDTSSVRLLPGEGSIHTDLQQRCAPDAVLPSSSEQGPSWWWWWRRGGVGVGRRGGGQRSATVWGRGRQPENWRNDQSKSPQMCKPLHTLFSYLSVFLNVVCRVFLCSKRRPKPRRRQRKRRRKILGRAKERAKARERNDRWPQEENKLPPFASTDSNVFLCTCNDPLMSIRRPLNRSSPLQVIHLSRIQTG